MGCLGRRGGGVGAREGAPWPLHPLVGRTREEPRCGWSIRDPKCAVSGADLGLGIKGHGPRGEAGGAGA